MKECRSLSAPCTHVSNLAALCILDVGGRKKKEREGTFQSKRKKESLIRLAAALWTKLLSADALLLKLAWVMSSDALQS